MQGQVRGHLKEDGKGKLNILYVSHYSHFRMGGQKSTIAIIEKLDRTRFTPFALVPARGELSDRLESLGCRCIVVPMHNIKVKNIFRLILQWRRIRRVIQSFGIDIIHVDQDHDACVCMCASKVTRAKLIWHVRLTRPYKLDCLNKRGADSIITVADDVQNRFGTCEKVRDKCRTIYNGVDCDLFRPADSKGAVREKLQLPGERFILTFVGQIKEGKGVFDLAEAARLMREAVGDRAKPLILYIGTPKDRATQARLEQMVSDYGLDGVVKICAQQKNIHEWMQASDVLVQPSHEGVEGMSRVLYEGMACGTAVITTSISGNREAVTPRTGLLVPEHSPEAIAEAVKKLMDDRAFLSDLQVQGRGRATELFDFKKNIKTVERTYLECVSL